MQIFHAPHQPPAHISHNAGKYILVTRVISWWTRHDFTSTHDSPLNVRWRRCEQLSAVDRAGRGPGDAVCLCGCVCPQIHGTKSQMIIYLRTCTADRMCLSAFPFHFPFNTYVAAAPTPPITEQPDRRTGALARAPQCAMTHKTHKMNRNDMNQEWPNAHTWILFSAPQPLPLGYRVRPDASALDRTGAAAASSKVALPQSHARHPTRSVQL